MLLGSLATDLLDLGSNHKTVRATYFIENESIKRCDMACIE